MESHERRMTTFSSLRVRLVGVVFLAVVPVLLLMYFTNLPWIGFVMGLVALAAAWRRRTVHFRSGPCVV